MGSASSSRTITATGTDFTSSSFTREDEPTPDGATGTDSNNAGGTSNDNATSSQNNKPKKKKKGEIVSMNQIH